MSTRSPLARGAWLALAAGLGLVSTGCEDTLAKATEIEHMRILGAKLEVVGDEQRSSPKPGDRVRVTLATRFETLDVDRSKMQMLMLGCTAPTRFTGGVPVCQELIDAAETGNLDMAPEGLAAMFDERFACPGPFTLALGGALSLTCAVGDPTAELAVPQDFEADKLLFLGVMCEDGTAVIDPTDPQLFGCDPKEEEVTEKYTHGEDDEEDERTVRNHEAIRLHGLIQVQRKEEDENHNPDMGGLRMTGVDLSRVASWEPIDSSLLTPETEQDCASVPESPMLPHTHDTGHRNLRVSYDTSVLEDENGLPEVLELTTYVTHGEIERRFTLLRADDANDDDGNDDKRIEADLKWTPEEEATSAQGVLARFIVTIRDDRGGFGIVEYATCLVTR